MSNQAQLLGRRLERVMGIEPTWPAWKAGALPLSYTRAAKDTNGLRTIVNVPLVSSSGEVAGRLVPGAHFPQHGRLGRAPRLSHRTPRMEWASSRRMDR